jgi:hypothetical protein
MKTFLKVLLLVLAVAVAVKLMPIALIFGGVLALVAALVAAVGLSLAAGLVGVGLFLAFVSSPIWLPILALLGLIALVKRLAPKPAGA